MKCWECEKETNNIHQHHVVPRSRGGTKTLPLCQECHSKAHHMRKNMNTSVLTKQALAKKKKRGERLGSPPASFRMVDGVLYPTDETEIVVMAVRMRQGGAKLREVQVATGWLLTKTHRVCSFWKGKEEELYNIWENKPRLPKNTPR